MTTGFESGMPGFGALQVDDGRIIPFMTPPTVGALANKYLSGRTNRRELLPTSVTTIRYALWTFVESVGADLPAKKVTRRHIDSWLERNRQWGRSTTRNRLSIIRTFCRWMVTEGHITRDPCAGIQGPRQPRYKPRALDVDTVGFLIDWAPDARTELMVTLMAQEGLRCCEVATLEVGDIDFNNREMIVRGKRDKERGLPISDQTWDAMRRYLAGTPIRSGPLLRSQVRPQNGLSPGHVSKIVRDLIGDANIVGTPHQLRHSAATDMLRAGAHPRDVQKALGHANLSTTELYLPDEVKGLRRAMGGRRYGKRIGARLGGPLGQPRPDAVGAAGDGSALVVEPEPDACVQERLFVLDEVDGAEARAAVLDLVPPVVDEEDRPDVTDLSA